MTTIDMTGTPRFEVPQVPAARTRLRLTVRGRRVLAGLAAAPLAVALSAIILTTGGGAIASSEQGVPAGTFETVTVMPGESLWSIAERVAPTADPRDVVYEISQLNALGSATLDVGQSLAIPAAYAEGK